MKRSLLTIQTPTVLEIIRKSSPLTRQAYRWGNASGIHGGRRCRYGKTERQQARREERDA
jgi:hypothetical protein